MLRRAERLKQTRQQRRPAPVIDHAKTHVDHVEVRPHQDRGGRRTGMIANQIRRANAFDRMFAQGLGRASGIFKELLERFFAFGVVAAEISKARFHQLLRDGIRMEILRRRGDSSRNCEPDKPLQAAGAQYNAPPLRASAFTCPRRCMNSR